MSHGKHSGLGLWIVSQLRNHQKLEAPADDGKRWLNAMECLISENVACFLNSVNHSGGALFAEAVKFPVAGFR
jgi:hypothetical protein